MKEAVDSKRKESYAHNDVRVLSKSILQEKFYPSILYGWRLTCKGATVEWKNTITW